MSHNGPSHDNGWHLQYSCCNEDARSELAALCLRGRKAVAIAAAGGRVAHVVFDVGWRFSFIHNREPAPAGRGTPCRHGSR